MVRHVVMWKVKDSSDKNTALQTLRSALQSLPAKIPQIVEFEVGIDFSQQGDSSADIVLLSSFASDEDLHIYQKHPEHLKAVELIRSLTFDKKVADYNFMGK